MDRKEFELIRDVSGKTITDDIVLKASKNISPALRAENIVINNSMGTLLHLHIHYNPEIESKTFNVVAAGIGPICRIDVDGPPHRPAGRSHKHSLQDERCPSRNLPTNVIDKPEFSKKSLRETFDMFCQLANIEFTGTFKEP